MFSSIKPADKVNFVKNLSIMLKSGVAIDEALIELAEQARATRFKKIILAVKEDVAHGSPLSASFAKYGVFDDVFKALMRTGEVSGGLEENLIFLADWLERENDMRKEINSATLYPKIVIGAVVSLAIGLNLFVVPKLLPLFSDMDIELPWTTTFIFASSAIMLEYWYAVIGGVIAIILGIIALGRIPSVRKLRDAFYLRIPFFGTLMTDYEMAVIAQLFYTCFKSGVPMHESILIIRDTIDNAEYRASFTAIAERVRTGTALSAALKEYP
ncbi:MAG: type II secretion system F family protein, partial [bacterium]|nr:type II secretion system F family protein [bacterium]